MRTRLLTLFLSMLAVQSLYGLSTDRQQNIEIQADSAEMDDINGVSVYRDDVVVVQGSIRMTGDIMTVYFDDDGGMKLVVMEGKPATYQQLPDDSQTYDKASALLMKYYAMQDHVILINQALVTQEKLRFSGDRIEYDTITNQVKARGDAKSAKASEDKAGTKKDSRVKIIIKKK